MDTSKRPTLREWRQLKGISQLDLAYLSKISLSTLSDIESGKRYPRIDKALKLCEILGIDIGQVEWMINTPT